MVLKHQQKIKRQSANPKTKIRSLTLQVKSHGISPHPLSQAELQTNKSKPKDMLNLYTVCNINEIDEKSGKRKVTIKLQTLKTC